MSKATLRSRLRAKETLLGTMVRIPSPEVVEIAAHAGFDFVIVDTEHGPYGVETAARLVRAADAAGIAPLVRVAENSPSQIAKALDIGSQGVIVPKIANRAEALRAVQGARFHPLGQRGACPRVRAANYTAIEPVQYFAEANERTLLIPIVETAEGAANLPEIVGVLGVDAILLGATDLAQSLGVPGQNDHPLVLGRLAEMLAIVQGAGLAAGRVAFDVAEGHRHLRQGVQLLVYSGDETLFYQVCRGAVAALREMGTEG